MSRVQMSRVHVRRTVMLAAVLSALTVGLAAGSAAGAVAADRRSGAAPRAAAAPGFTFTIDSSWTDPTDRATLTAWVTAGSPELMASQQVVGLPKTHIAVTVVNAVLSGVAGEYDPTTHTMYLTSVDLGVFEHELNHAVHDRWMIGNEVWEEGQARAAEVAELDLLAGEGVPAAQNYFDLRHGYTYDVYYDNVNRPNIGVSLGLLRGLGEETETLLRYEQAGYAFGKMIIERPRFMVRFNAALFALPAGGDYSDAVLESMAEQIAPKVEGVTFATWYAAQGILDSSPPTGCQALQRINQLNVDILCRSASGLETPQTGITVHATVRGVNGVVLWQESEVTTALGWIQVSPQLGSYQGRIAVAATAMVQGSHVSSTYYRTVGFTGGVFGVVTNKAHGTVTLSSPTGRFATETVPVSNGAFQAPDLTSFAGQVHLVFTGGGSTATRTITKDGSPYSVVLTAA